MAIKVLMPRSFKLTKDDSENIERKIEAEEVNNHYLFNMPAIFIPSGTRKVWYIAKKENRIAYMFFRTKRQAIKHLKEVSDEV